MNIGTSKKYFKAIVATVLTAATISACEKSPAGDETEVIDSVINIEGKKVISVVPEAGEFEISYTVSGASFDKEAVAVPDAEWLTVAAADETEVKSAAAQVGETRIVKILCAANETSEDRTAKVALTLKGAKSVSVSVLQKAGSDYRVNPTMKLSLDVTDIDETSALITVAPNADSYYYYCVATAEVFNSYTEKSGFLADRVAAVKDAAKAYSEKYGTPYSLSGYLYKGYRALTYKGFTPDTDFVLVAFDMSLSGDYSGNYETLSFHTKAVTPSSSDFEITLSADKSDVKVVPRDKVASYYIVLTNGSLWEQYMTPEGCVEAYMDNYTPDKSYVGDTPVLSTGLNGKGDYLLLVFGYDTVLKKTTTGISYLLFHYDGE